MQRLADQPMDSAVASSTFIVEGSNVEERTELVPSGDSWIFTCIDRPSRPARGMVLICPSIYAEFVKNYRCEVLMARTLAASDLVVGRFHYRGTGHSGDVEGPVTAASMIDDARAAYEHIRRDAPQRATILLGTRWGALIAASLAAESPGSSVVLAEPIIDIGQLVRDAMRSMAIRELRKGSTSPASLGRQDDIPVPTEGLHAVGYRIERPFFESAAGMNLGALVAAAHRSVLLIQIRRASKPSPTFVSLANDWRESGLEVGLRTIEEQVAWWLEPGLWNGGEERQSAQELIANRLVELTVEWTMKVNA